MSTDKRTIYWYNDNAEEYTKHVQATTESVYHSYYEKPAMYSLLPDIKDKKVISLGCGSGEDSEYLRSLETSQSIGVDISEKLIDIAKSNYPKCDFKVMDMEKIDFSDSSFDFAYSSLAIHYIENWTNTFKEVYRILKPNSYFLFSCNHPLRSAMIASQNETEKIHQLAIIKSKTTNEITIIGNYLDRSKLDIKIGKGTTITAWHKSISEIISEIKKAGFLIEDFVEPKPISEMESISLKDFKSLNKIPKFMIFKLIKI